MLKSKWVRIIQILVSIGLICILFIQIQWTEFFFVIRELKFGHIAFGFLLLIARHLINILRWYLLLPKKSVSLIELISYYGLGMFSNYFLPTGFGGDGVRIALLSQNVSIKLSFFSVALDRFFGFITVIVFFLIGLQIGFPIQLNFNNSSLLLGMKYLLILIITIIFALLLVSRIRHRLINLFRSIDFKKYFNYAIEKGTSLILIILFLSVASQLMLAIVYWIVLNSLSINIPFSASVWMVTIFSIILFLPISINGIGVQENIGLMILEYYGVLPISAISVVLIIRTYSILLSAFGGLFYLVSKNIKMPATKINDNPIH